MIEWVSNRNEVHTGQYFSLLLWTLKSITVTQQGKSYKSLSEKLQELYDFCSFQFPKLHLHQFASLPPVNKQFYKFGFYEVV